ncbi:MAG: DNA-binding protein [Flavobacteriales bacterium]|nr:MAG: DNA-binding protein [Flavobacteriales bacterium]
MKQPIETEQFLTVAKTAEFLSLSVQTIYDKVAKGDLLKMKSGKRLYFSKEQLIEYIKEGAVKSNKEIDAAAESYLNNKR